MKKSQVLILSAVIILQNNLSLWRKSGSTPSGKRSKSVRYYVSRPDPQLCFRGFLCFNSIGIPLGIVADRHSFLGDPDMTAATYLNAVPDPVKCS
jgi:hypothetical protein